MQSHHHSSKRLVQLFAAGLAVAAAVAVIALPLYAQESSTSTGGVRSGSATVLSVVGPQVLLTLLVPVLGAALPLAARGRAWQPLSVASAVVLAVFVALGSASIGWFFVPALVLAAIALFQPASEPAGSSPTPTP